MKCFVISPIGDEASDVRKHADEVFKYIIAPVLAHFGIEAVRSDQLAEPRGGLGKLNSMDKWSFCLTAA